MEKIFRCIYREKIEKRKRKKGNEGKIEKKDLKNGRGGKMEKQNPKKKGNDMRKTKSGKKENKYCRIVTKIGRKTKNKE